jgi:hypothetical protein
MTSAIPVAAALAANPQRMVFIDVARSLAILIALAAHAVTVFGVWPAVPPGLAKAAGNALFYTATPTFFLLFGVMLELVQVRRRERDGALAVTRSLGLRAGQCWLGLLLGMLCAWLGGRLASSQLPDALLNLIDTPNSGILRFYTAAMLLCIPVVICRPRLGPAMPLALVGAIWIGATLLPLLPWPSTASRWGFLCGFLVAHPPTWSAGSLWHNLSVVFMGMVLGHHMRNRTQAGLVPLGGTPLHILVLVCLFGIALSAWTLGALELARGYLGTGRYLRSTCHPAYFLISSLCALALIWLAQLRYPLSTTMAQVRLPILALGRHPLLAFAVGCAALNLIPPDRATPPLLGILSVALFLTGIVLLARLADTWTPRRSGR